jgi:hypothetical protein
MLHSQKMKYRDEGELDATEFGVDFGLPNIQPVSRALA